MKPRIREFSAIRSKPLDPRDAQTLSRETRFTMRVHPPMWVWICCASYKALLRRHRFLRRRSNAAARGKTVPGVFGLRLPG